MNYWLVKSEPKTFRISRDEIRFSQFQESMDENAEKIMQEIEFNGLKIIKGIIESNNPLDKQSWPLQFQIFSKALAGLSDLE